MIEATCINRGTALRWARGIRPRGNTAPVGTDRGHDVPSKFELVMMLVTPGVGGFSPLAFLRGHV